MAWLALMETGTILGVGALLVSAAGALNSFRKTGQEDRTSAVSELRTVVQTLKEENERMKIEQRESEDECRRQIADCNARFSAHQDQIKEMRETIIQQANQIKTLERRRDAR